METEWLGVSNIGKNNDAGRTPERTDMKETDITPEEMELYRKVGDYWDTHDTAEGWDQTYPVVELSYDIRSSEVVYPIDMDLANKLRAIAHLRGESAEKLMEAWLWDRLRREAESDGLDLESLGIPKPVIS